MASSSVAPPLRLRPYPSTTKLRLVFSTPPRFRQTRETFITPDFHSKSLKAINLTLPASSEHRRLRLATVQASSPSSSAAQGSDFEQWDSITAKFAGSANLPFLLLQLPQIVLNARNLLSGNPSALFAVPWLGMLTGLLGNLSLLSYFAKKRETEAVLVQTLGVISTYVVILQLAMAQSMPLPQFVATSIVVALGLVLNFLNYFSRLNDSMWRLWEDFITIGGLSVLPQVMWSTFVPFIPNSILPGVVCCVLGMGAVVMARSGRLSEEGVKFVGALSGWTATLLFMWMPVSQMWTNYLNPDNIRGLSAFSMLLAMIGNGLMIPRALFIRDLMWFTGSTWATLFYGWGNLACMYCFSTISREFFLATTAGLLLWLGTSLWRDTVAHGYEFTTTSMLWLKSFYCRIQGPFESVMVYALYFVLLIYWSGSSGCLVLLMCLYRRSVHMLQGLQNHSRLTERMQVLSMPSAGETATETLISFLVNAIHALASPI
ncbi:hypothetical protein J5N97_018899 [Dioscorea zingiberensis]|uniref:Maltose excess protein 1-like, chloroplastic n=1 Tax=Dioscorea zingiberensis TaxID=325984 RepID=A0A9D5CDQ7_9LILI|nr:hypothetical protein J5N97_018899 [Dioscorea zingiberensis]